MPKFLPFKVKIGEVEHNLGVFVTQEEIEQIEFSMGIDPQQSAAKTQIAKLYSDQIAMHPKNALSDEVLLKATEDIQIPNNLGRFFNRQKDEKIDKKEETYTNALNKSFPPKNNNNIEKKVTKDLPETGSGLTVELPKTGEAETSERALEAASSRIMGGNIPIGIAGQNLTKILKQIERSVDTVSSEIKKYITANKELKKQEQEALDSMNTKLATLKSESEALRGSSVNPDNLTITRSQAQKLEESAQAISKSMSDFSEVAKGNTTGVNVAVKSMMDAPVSAIRISGHNAVIGLGLQLISDWRRFRTRTKNTQFKDKMEKMAYKVRDAEHGIGKASNKEKEIVEIFKEYEAEIGKLSTSKEAIDQNFDEIQRLLKEVRQIITEKDPNLIQGIYGGIDKFLQKQLDQPDRPLYLRKLMQFMRRSTKQLKKETSNTLLAVGVLDALLFRGVILIGGAVISDTLIRQVIWNGLVKKGAGLVLGAVAGILGGIGQAIDWTFNISKNKKFDLMAEHIVHSDKQRKDAKKVGEMQFRLSEKEKMSYSERIAIRNEIKSEEKKLKNASNELKSLEKTPKILRTKKDEAKISELNSTIDILNSSIEDKNNKLSRTGLIDGNIPENVTNLESAEEKEAKSSKQLSKIAQRLADVDKNAITAGKAAKSVYMGWNKGVGTIGKAGTKLVEKLSDKIDPNRPELDKTNPPKNKGGDSKIKRI